MLALKRTASNAMSSELECPQADSKSQAVAGGLPPHTLRERDNTDPASQASVENHPSANVMKPASCQPQAVIGGIPPHLLRQRENANTFSSGPGSVVLIEPPASKENIRPQQMATCQTRPSTLESLPQPTPSRDAPLEVTLKNEYPPTPAYQDAIKEVPLAIASNQIDPVQKKKIGDRFAITVRNTPPGSPPTPVLDRDTVDQGQDRTPKTPGIPEIKKWRPKHSIDLESQSLPSTAASVNFSNDSHFPDRDSDDCKDTITKDTRANIADELDIVPNGNDDGWANKHVWKDYASSPHSPSGGNNSDSFFGPFMVGWRGTFCENWIASVTKYTPPIASSIEKLDGHWRCDVDPMNGFLMSPVDYPETRINPNDPCSGAELDRRLRGTAAMRSTTDFLKMKKRVLKRDRQELEYLASNPPRRHWKRSAPQQPQTSPVPAPAPVRAIEAAQDSRQQVVPATEVPAAPIQQGFQDDADSRNVKIRCHLRPAEQADAPQILEIYNWEVMNGNQALDAKPLVLQDIQRLLAECMSARMPFIVAAQGPPMAAASQNGAPAQPRGPYTQHRPTAPYQKIPEVQPVSQKILGFGFISCPVAGLAGSVHTNVGRFIGKVHFYVEHASRRNGIGRALLHKLTRCGSRYTISVDWYEWYDPARSPVFDEPDFNSRNYSRLYVETSSTGEKDPDNGWYEEFLDKMGYLFMSTLEKTRKVKYDSDDQWRDTIIWQHECRDHKGIREFD